MAATNPVTGASPASQATTVETTADLQAKRDKQEIERLRSKHEDYAAKEEHWKFTLRSYEGGPEYVSEDTLFKHQREHHDDYMDRLKRAHYTNYCQPLVDFVPEFIFEQPIERDPGTALRADFDRFVKNVDRAGTDLTTFMRDAAEHARIFGSCFIQVDKVARPADVDPITLSAQRERELGLDLPYFILVRPLEILNWSTDAFGNFQYIKRVQYGSRFDESDLSFLPIETYYEWTRSAVRITALDVSDPDKPKILSRDNRPNAWKAIPFVQVIHKRSKVNRDLAVSFLQDIAYQNRKVFNLTSLVDEFLYRQCFNILAMEKETGVPTKDQVEGEMSTSNVLEIPRLAEHEPYYLSPPVDPASFIQEERSSVVQEMYRQAAQDISSELFAVSNRSGDAARESFGRSIPVIAKMADMLQLAEHQLFRLWALMMRKKWEGKIAYKDDYGVMNLQDLILQLSTVFNNLRVLSPTFIKEEWKRIIREMDGRIDPEKMRDIIKEIDSLPEQKLLDLYMLTPDVQATAGVPSTANLIQGRTQSQLGTDKRIAAATGSKAATKEANPDANKRTRTARGVNRDTPGNRKRRPN